ncbi:MAG: tetratricopeptide repeat protein [Alphaproteobacteria bacterium]|nr:tetratricopeptide repeat protein [Alphaproteobacteria bacterium]
MENSAPSPVRPAGGASPFSRLVALGGVQVRQHNYAAAIKTYREALTLNPEAPAVHVVLSTCLEQQYKKTLDKSLLEAAAESARTALRLAPENPRAHLRYASILIENKKWKEGEAEIEKAMALDPQSESPHMFLGLLYWQRRKYDKALDCFEAVLRKSPENVQALVNCGGYWLHIKGDKAKAEDYARQALRIAPENNQAQVLMGNLLLREGKTEEAMEHARIVLSRVPDDYATLLLVAIIESRRNWLRGMGFRFAVLFLKIDRGKRLALLRIGLFAGALGGFAGAAAAGLPEWVCIAAGMIPSCIVIYLRASLRGMKKYVIRNYLSPQNLKKDF